MQQKDFKKVIKLRTSIIKLIKKKLNRFLQIYLPVQMETLQQQAILCQNEPPTQKQQQTNHSLSADLAMGWRPKLKVIGPIPLNFDNDFVDKSIKDLLKSQASIYRVVYLGPRPLNTFKMHEVLKKKYKYKYQHLFAVEYGHLKAFFHKFYSQFEPKMKMPFLGMNPAYKSHKIIFDSCFESGNLDCVVKVNEFEYDMILRIDSNTAGHIMWYYFKATNNENTTQKVKFNIVNLRRNKSCYQRGMKPFIRRKLKTQSSSNGLNGEENWTTWAQGGTNIQVEQEKIRFGKQTFIFNNGLVGIEESPMIFRRLTFQIQFEPFEQIQLAYCVPYTYSDMMNDLKLLKQTIVEQKSKNIHFEIDTNNESLSGLQIPVLKITEKENDKYDQETQKSKFCVFIVGRQHPGESNGSWVVRGILQQLIKDTPEMNYLRRHIVFKIFPMLNVDGVVMGNFRTSLYGKDLNRLFKKQQLFLIPEVETFKEEFNKLIKTHKNKIMVFLDIHGHSARRNAFCYGPGILDANAFSDVRQFAKIIASNTQIFRYPSCSFRIDHDKKTTARACFSKSVGLAYTIESSNWSFYSRSQTKMIDFTQKSWEKVGQCLIESLYEYAEDKIMKKLSKKKKKNKIDKNVIKGMDKKNANQPQGSKGVYSIEIQTLRKSDKNASSTASEKISKRRSQSRQLSSKINTTNKQHFQNVSQNDQDADRQVSSPKRHHNLIHKKGKHMQMLEIEEAQNQSDRMSDNEMDSDSEDQDMEKSKFQKYMNGAKKMMIEFQKVYFGEEYEKKGRTAAKLRNEAKKLLKQSSNKNIKKNSQILACLRKKEPMVQQGDAHQSTLVDIAGKIKLQPRKGSNNNTFVLNTKVAQFEYPPNQQESRQQVDPSKKFSIQKIILPRIEGSYQAKRRQDYLQKGGPYQKVSRIEEWSQNNETPQLEMQDQDSQKEYLNHEGFYISRQKIRQKSITNYEMRNVQHFIDPSPSQKRTEFQTVQSQNFKDESSSDSSMSLDSSEEPFENEEEDKIQRWSKMEETKRPSILRNLHEMELEGSSIRQIKESLRYNVLRNKVQNQPEQHTNMENNDDSQRHHKTGRQDLLLKETQSPNKSLRFSMRLESKVQIPSKSSVMTKNTRQISKTKKSQLIEKLSDPISMGYNHIKNQIISSEDLGGVKDKKNMVNFEFYNINYLKNETTNHQNTQFHTNHEKIQQIILNNLQLMKGSPNKINFKPNRQNFKDHNTHDLQQKISIEAIPLNKAPLTKSSPGEKQIQKKKTSLNLGTKNQSPQKLVQLGQDDIQHLVLSSVIIGRKNVTPVEKIKTLQSQHLLKHQMMFMPKANKNGVAGRNYSQKQSDSSEFGLLKQEESINRKVMKFGGQSLPKIENERNSKLKSPHEYSKTKLGLDKNSQKQTKQSPRKAQKPILSSLSPETDYTNIKLICINEKIPIDFQQIPTKQQSKRDINNSQNSTHKNVKKESKQMSRFQQQKQQEERQKFGEHNLMMNQELIEKEKLIKLDKFPIGEIDPQLMSKELNNIDTKRLKTNQSAQILLQMHKNPHKQMKIFVLPQGVHNIKSTYLK